MATRISKIDLDKSGIEDIAEVFMRYIACHRELLASAVVALVVGISVSSIVGSPIGMLAPLITAGIMLAFVPDLRENVLGWRAAGQLRVNREFTKYAWPTLCSEMGWMHGSGHAIFIPELLDVKVHEDGSRILVIRPLPSQKPKVWPAMAEQLSRYYGTPGFHVEHLDHGVVAMHLVFEQLPATVGYEVAHRSNEWDRVPLGVGVGEPVVEWVPSEVPHLLVAGATNAGKGSVLRLAMMHGLQSGWQVLGINPRLSGEFSWAAKVGVPIASNTDDILRMLQSVFGELQQRQQQVQATGVSSWVKLGNQAWAPLMVVVDEAATLLTPNKANKELAAQQIEIGDILARVAAIGRAVGIHLVIATQRPDAAALGPAGGQLRNNVEGRIAVGSLDPDGLRMMFSTSDPEVIGRLEGVKGRALVSKISGGDTDVHKVQLFYRSEEELLHEPPAIAVPQLSSAALLGGGVS